MNRSRMKGMTLIELVIVVAIVAILALVAVPSYRSYLLRSHRVEAAASLLALAAAQEKFYLQNNRYATNAELDEPPPDGLGRQTTSENDFYTIAITAADTASFTATATAKGGQLDDTRCKVFSIDETGEKLAYTSSSAAADDCWSR